MTGLVVLLVVVLPVAALVGAVVARVKWPRTLTNVLLGALVLVTAVAVLAWAAIATDFRDADGFIDCWPSCTPLQDAVGIAIFWGPVLMAALVVLAAAYLAVTSRRGNGRRAA